MDVNYINPFIESVVHVFKTALGCDIERKNLYLKDTAVPSHEVSGIIGLSGNASGVVVLSVSRQIAFQVVKTMLDMDVREVNGDVVDAVGELTNMVAGAAKRNWPNTKCRSACRASLRVGTTASRSLQTSSRSVSSSTRPGAP